MVYVININSEPLMPTNNARARILLKKGKAIIINYNPFTIQLLQETTNYKQPLIVGIDPGRTNIAATVVTTKGKTVYSCELATRNKDIPKLMQQRKACRMKHRQLNRRDKRQRRAVAANPELKTNIIERLLPGCDNPIICKIIKNKPAKFNNRKRPDGWLTPTANHLLITHINLIKKIQRILPISEIVIELNRFAFMSLDNSNTYGIQYQQGPLYGYDSLEQAVSDQQGNHCLFCKHKLDHYHHIVPVSKGGSNTIANRVGLCEKHHKLVHTDEGWHSKLLAKKNGLNKKYGALSVLNQIMPKLLMELSTLFKGAVTITTGYQTKQFRDNYGIDKSHYLDAYCIACSTLNDEITIAINNIKPYYLRQFRRHDRQACQQENLNRRYYLGKDCVAINRHKAIEQKINSLEEYALTVDEIIISQLSVKEHKPIYKDMERIYPGSLLIDSSNGKSFILQGSQGRQKGKPVSYHDTAGNKHKASDCELLRCNSGLVYI